MKRNIGVLLIVAVLAGVAVFQSLSNAKQEEMVIKDKLGLLSGESGETSESDVGEQAVKVNFQAPEFSLEGLDGQTYTVGGPRGKALLINFWASWCGPCHREAPDLIELHKRYGDRFDIYAVNVTKMDTIDNAIDFVDKYQFKFPILMDLENDVTSLYKVRSYPTNILVDTNGVIQEVFPRMLLPNDIKTIEKFLKKS